jgi:hypothetical protein
LYDVREETDLIALWAILNVPTPGEPRVHHPSPE